MPRISLQDRQRIVDSFVNGEDFVATAGLLGVKRTTAYTIVRRYERTGMVGTLDPAGRGRPSKLDDESINFLIMLIEANPSITLKRLNEEFRDTWPDKPHVSDSTISRALDAQLITLKKSHDVPVTRNSPATKNSRAAYAHFMYTLGIQRHRVYVDECGCNLFTKRFYGRAPVGMRVNRIVAGSRGNNVTAIVAISDKVGMLYHEISTKRVNIEVFTNFMLSLEAVLGEENALIIMDNSPVHNGCSTTYDQHEIQYLPPNSPFLNPIENCFSVMKSTLKQRLNIVQAEACNARGAAEAGVSMVAWRERILVRELSAALDESISRNIVESNYRHADGYLQQCSQKCDILS